jgi:hypothetical protein
VAPGELSEGSPTVLDRREARRVDLDRLGVAREVDRHLTDDDREVVEADRQLGQPRVVRGHGRNRLARLPEESEHVVGGYGRELVA